MADRDHRAGLFPALLKHWRGRRGLSQLDLALTAGVSSRHVSFLETGRSAPSPEMVLRLAACLNVPLRHINAMLTAAGHPPAYPDSQGLPDEVTSALQLMKDHHEPFPLLIVDRTYDILDLNRGAVALFDRFFGDFTPPPGQRLNLARLTFDPKGAKSTVVNFEEVARALLWRIHREVLAAPREGPLRNLLDELLGMSTIEDDWRNADLSVPASPALVLHLRVDDLDLRFLIMATVFQAPQAVMLDEMVIEPWFPQDAATVEGCHALLGASDYDAP
ncbi:MAG: helix-turn-helix transcriptional regulator [Myxococcota bacterium]